MSKVLSEEEIRSEYASPSPDVRAVIEKALMQQDWIRLHAEPRFVVPEGSRAYGNLKAMIQAQLPKDKYAVALSLLRFPLPTTDIVDSIFDSLSDIFMGRNPVANYQFRSASDLEDWEWYRHNVLREPSVWSTTAWEYFRTEINALVVVDLPAEGEDDPDDPHPQPYFYFVPISQVVSYGARPDGEMEWAMWRDSSGGLTVVDGASYRTYSLDRAGIIERKTGEHRHLLSRPPLKWLWSEDLSVTGRGVKKSPLSKALSKLDWYVFSDINKRYNDIAGSYPIYWGYEEECDYVDPITGDVCSHGLMETPGGKPAIDPSTGLQMLCPRCAQHRITGPGSFVSVPIPDGDQPSLGDPVGKLGVDKSSLDYIVSDLDRQRGAIIDSCIGREGDIIGEASLADKQIEATYEKRTTVLENVKKGFEALEEFVDSTVCRLRYGDSFMQCSISLGTVFFTQTADTLRERLTKAIEGGASQSEVQAIYEQIIQTEYRNNPQMLERMRILLQVEPYPYLSRSEVMDLYGRGLCDAVTLELKEDFQSYLMRFERENGNITEFAVYRDPDWRVNKIKKTLYDYADETRKERSDSGAYAGDVSGAGDGEESIPREAGAGEVRQGDGTEDVPAVHPEDRAQAVHPLDKEGA